uniref:WD_REPEATS_REGION domain-containing protein n=1 Tax=Panagrellus redivivus TaxID=6233 RepID=A0A7E4VMZ0_PANRE
MSSTPGGERTGLVVPVVLWGTKPPEFRISELTVLQGGSVIVAGSLDGQVIQWRVNEETQAIQPDMMMLAHEAPVTCLAPTSQVPTSTRYISCCQKGKLCVWNSVDGRCVESAKHPFVHRKIIPYSYQVTPTQSLTRLFCIGDYAEVLVIDAQDLNVLFNLTSRVEPDWINAITIVRTQANHDVVIGVSISGMIKLWSLRDLNKKDSANVLYEDESKVMAVKNVRAVSCSTLNTRIMLLVSASSWQIVDACSLNQLILSECAIEAVDGIIIDVDKIAVGFVDSTIVLFQLPRSRLNAQANPKPASGFDQPFVFALLKGFSPSPRNSFTSNVSFFFDARGTADGHPRRVAYRADNNGRIAVWRIPHNFEPLVEECLRSKRPIVYNPTLEESLPRVWRALKPGPPGIFDSPNCKITSTIYICNQGKLLLGCEDGRIVMMNACRAIMSQLLEYAPSESVQHRILHAHMSAVTCFLYPFEESSRYDPNILISGGMDFAVVVWNLTTGSKLHRFCNQGGAIQRLLIPPDNCNARILHCICSIASDNSAALLSLKENRCVLLASRQSFPIIEIKWRPLDDFMLIRCEDECVYVWQMETANLDRIVTGLVSEDVMEACNEQAGVADGDDEAGANQATQMLRALKNKNLAAVKKIALNTDRSSRSKNSGPEMLPLPIDIVSIQKCSNEMHILLFNVDAIIIGLHAMDNDVSNGNAFNDSGSDAVVGKPSLSSLLAKKQQDAHNNANPTSNGKTAGSVVNRWLSDTNLYVDSAKLLMSLVYGWNLDDSKDSLALNRLKLQKPKVPLSFGTISRNGIMSLYMPSTSQSNENGGSLFQQFSKSVHWNLSNALTTIHLVTAVALSNTLMSLQSRTLHVAGRKGTLKRVSSVQSTDSSTEAEGQQIKEGWSAVAAMHCVMLPELITAPLQFAPPKVDLLARRWQDSCMDIRDASQALLIRELNRTGSNGRKKLLHIWAPFLPTLLDPSLSIFGKTTTANVPFATSSQPAPLVAPVEQNHYSSNASLAGPAKPKQPPSRPPPPIPPRNSANSNSLPDPVPQTDMNNDFALVHLPDHAQSGVNQVRRNQATAVVLLGVIGAEFPDDFDHGDVVRATAHSLLELLIAPESQLLPLNSALRRAAMDLMGRGFTIWQPHLDISKVLIGLLDLASMNDKQKSDNHVSGSPLNPSVDASRTARHALSLIASVRSQALITALSMEVARYNNSTQHQTIQHSVTSPLIRSRVEVLRIIEQLSEKQYNDVAELIIPVGDILVHCLDINQLRHHSLAEIFPPIAKFYMIGYCPASRRIAFGGRNGSIVVHELKTMKSQTVQANNSPITAVAFSQDGKYLAAYAAKDAKINFWQTQQSFLGMGQSQMRFYKSLAAPTEFAVLSPGGTYQPFRARLVWINAKSLTLMLPNGRENRFAI